MLSNTWHYLHQSNMILYCLFLYSEFKSLNGCYFELEWFVFVEGTIQINFFHDTEFWKQIPPNEPYRVILGDVRDKLYQTRERARQILAHGISDIPEEAVFTNVEQVSL